MLTLMKSLKINSKHLKKKMGELVIIIPMHEFGKENIELLNKAVASVPENHKVYLSVKKGTAKASLNGISERLQVISESEGDTFCELVNAAVENIPAHWFSILEYDDEYTKIWADNAKLYMQCKPDTSVFMFLEDIVDYNDRKYIGFGNEAPLAAAFSNELGYIDNESLQNYFNFYMTGSIFNRDDWNEVGGLKKSIKVTFWYEWLLRTTNKGKKIYVIPKVGYTHKLNRNGSLTERYKNELETEEIDWWFDLAKREYLFKEDRNKVYEPSKSDEEIAEEA